MSYKVIALVTDAYGGRGGIAAYNRNLLKAVCAHPDVSEVVAIPRQVTYALEPMPANLRFDKTAAGTKLRYAASVLGLAAEKGPCGLILCGHLHLLPFAWFLGQRFGCPVLPMVYGIEAWTPSHHASVNFLCRRLKAFATIRQVTAARLKRWAGIENATAYYLPNCVDLTAFGAGPKRPDLLRQYNLEGKTVIMTAGRMDASEMNKGFDEVIETLPLLLGELPDVAYLIMGDGNDRPRLEAKARELGVAERVAFTGYVSEAAKADHYRLADVVAMPGSGPTYDSYPFRFAFLEPLACGVPIVGATLEDPVERADPVANQLVVQVDPRDRMDIKRGILEALKRRGQDYGSLLQDFSYPTFERRAQAIVSDVVRTQGRAPR
ncbi:MAG TPA: glycosyltransferase [Rhizomicrobium sp.]|jgi:glycosyltransferase involved in cell wall biosynthesis|nr:glycosyltransferase [Rhizomicrobium sp.]